MTTKETYRYRGDDIVPVWQSPPARALRRPKTANDPVYGADNAVTELESGG